MCACSVRTMWSTRAHAQWAMRAHAQWATRERQGNRAHAQYEQLLLGTRNRGHVRMLSKNHVRMRNTNCMRMLGDPHVRIRVRWEQHWVGSEQLIILLVRLLRWLKNVTSATLMILHTLKVTASEEVNITTDVCRVWRCLLLYSSCQNLARDGAAQPIDYQDRFAHACRENWASLEQYSGLAASTTPTFPCLQPANKRRDFCFENEHSARNMQKGKLFSLPTITYSSPDRLVCQSWH